MTTAKGILTCTKKKIKKWHVHTNFKILDSMSQFYHRFLSCDLSEIGEEVLYLLLSEWILLSKWWDSKTKAKLIVFWRLKKCSYFCTNVYKEKYRNNWPNTTLTFSMFGCFFFVCHCNLFKKDVMISVWEYILWLFCTEFVK